MPTLVREDAVLHENFGDSQTAGTYDIVCFSHLRWNFVFQRPQHLLSRAAQAARVFYIEEPLFEDVDRPMSRTHTVQGGVIVVEPVLPAALLTKDDAKAAIVQADADLVRQLLQDYGVTRFVSWYYTPMALAFTQALEPAAVVYDCMDELSAFRGAPPELLDCEEELLRRADVVFTGGASLYQSKNVRHANVRLFPSSVDTAHFAQALVHQQDPADQANIPHPRVGFYGVLDERMDFSLLARIADLRPHMHFVLLGPLAKIQSEDLPQRPNLHYLGAKSYNELPTYLSGWDASMLPFALNEATKYISPTKTPEYLAAHRQAVSTPIRDVVAPYGDEGLVAIAETADEFAAALDDAITPPTAEWLAKVEDMLSKNSWDRTWKEMRGNVADVLADKQNVR